MRRIMPRQRKASAFTAKFSKSLASLRQRPSHANVLSTIQRLAKGTKPSAPPRLTISSRQRPVPATPPGADDLQPPAAGPGHRRRGRLAPVGAVGEDHLDEREQPPRGAQQRDGPVPVLDVGGMDRGAQEQAQRVDQDVPLLALDLLARVVTRRIDARPPFSAPFPLWLSMIAAVGLASLPASSRTWTNKAWCRRLSVPSQAQSVR